MKSKYKSLVIVIVLCVAVLGSTACSSGQEKQESTNTITGKTISGKIQVEYTERDLNPSWEESEAIKVALVDTYTITEGGTYIFSGTLKDGQIIVNAANQDKVEIVLNGADINCSNGPGILVNSADKVFIFLPEGSDNSVSDGSSYASTDDESWGAIFSQADLTINGSGKLTVSGNYNNGIVTKDDLRIAGGILDVTAKNNGIKGRDSVGIYDGTILISAGKDGIKSDNSEKKEKGFVSIDGGMVNITNSTGQGIQAETVAQITGGTVDIQSSNEGIQGKIVYVQDGKLTIDADDDGINATDGSAAQGPMDDQQEGVYIEIAGGTTEITANGDGLDSNGDLVVSSGNTIIQGPENSGNASLDYAGKATITGGTFVAVGTAAMAQNFSEEGSSQCALMYNGDNIKSGTIITLKDQDGQEISSIKATVNFSSVLISTPDLNKGNTYIMEIGTTNHEINLSSIIVTDGADVGIGGGGIGGGGRPGSGRQGTPMERPK